MANKYFVEVVNARAARPFVGRSYDRKDLVYGPVSSRSAALSGIARLVKKNSLKPTAAPGGTTTGRRKVNNIVLVLDRSQSMSHLRQAAVDALNSNIDTIAREAARTGQLTNVSVYTFASDVRCVRQLQDVARITRLSVSDVYCGGMTALFDATGVAIDDLLRVPVKNDEDVSYLVQIITDGGENASYRYGSARDSSPLTKLMTRVQNTDLWTLTFLVPSNQGGRDTLVNMGIPPGNIAEWEQSVAGVQAYTQTNTQSFSNYFTSRASGQSSVKSFYTDLSNLKPADVKNALQDISRNVRVLQVTREENIKDFVEQQLGSYRPGSAFYQLMKDEKKVQLYKELLVMEKNKRQIFGGPDARQVLGIPAGQTLKIKPGNHGNFDIFVQSTSLNRKLPRGTKLLVRV